MPRFPTPGEYQEALQFPDTAFVDPELRAGEIETTPLGLPRVITGAFAAVFPVTAKGSRYAVRCFLGEVPGQKSRYRAVSRYLASGKADPARRHLVPFELQPDGLRVGGAAYPLLKMGWAEGVALNRYVAAHTDDPQAVEALAEAWSAMLARFEAAGIAHGDLQHGNVLVRYSEAGVQLTAVDYDTLYVPALKGRRSPEAGHRNYQHPDRSERDFGSWLDRFAGLAVYTALRACALRPGLWAQYDTGENLLFRATDFYDPGASPLFRELSEIEEIRDLVEALRTACHVHPAAIPTLADVRTGVRVTQNARSVFRFARSAAGAERQGRAESHTLSARAFLPFLLCWISASAILVMAGRPSGAAAFLAIGFAALGVWSALGFRRHPVVRRRRRLLREVAFFERVVAKLAEEIGGLRMEREKVAEGIGALREARVAELREQLLEERLKYHFVGEVAELPGVPHRMVVKLKMHGIRTAYHATPERLRTVSEVSPQTRARVEAWRARLVEENAPDLPDALSPVEERRLERHVQQKLDVLHAEEARIREKIAVQEKERAEVLARRAQLPEITYGRYLSYLLRLGKLPPSRVTPPRPPGAPPPGTARPETLPRSPDETPWWQDQEAY